MKTNKVAIITGSGRGIGSATAKLFAENDYAVCINYKSNSKAATKTENLITNQGGRCISVQADVSLEEEVQNLFNTVDRELGLISVLVNNAGILKKQCRLEDMTADRINSVLINNREIDGDTNSLIA